MVVARQLMPAYDARYRGGRADAFGGIRGRKGAQRAQQGTNIFLVDPRDMDRINRL